MQRDLAKSPCRMPFQNTFKNTDQNQVKGSAENSRQINRKFGVELLGNSFANLYRSIDNISNFA